MKKTVLVVLFLVASFIIFSEQTQAKETFFYYLLPPPGEIIVNDKTVSNDSTTHGKMWFQKEEGEEMKVGKNQQGVIVESRNFRVQIKGEASIQLTQQFSLVAGSVHIVSLPNTSGQETVIMGNLTIRFQSADFLAFVSGDGVEKILKVIEGEIEIEHQKTLQKAIIKAKQETRTDSLGRLLIPTPFELALGDRWWESKAYTYPYYSLPIAHAGEDQRVLGNIPVMLDGSKSSFKTGDIFEWILMKGPEDEVGKPVTEVAFDSTNIVKPLFTPTLEGEYQFTLEITDADGQKSNADTAIVYVGKRYLKPLAIFPDVPADHPNNLAITYLYKKNVMKGSEDPKTGKILFRPDDPLNRVEILKIIFENQREKIPTQEDLRAFSEEIFLDVKKDHWFAPYVFLGKKLGLVKGNNGLYRPADDVNLVEALKIILLAYKINPDQYMRQGEKPYADADADLWYSPYLFFAQHFNLIDPDRSGFVYPAKPISRAHFSEIVYRMENINLSEKRGVLKGFVKDTKTKTGIAGAEIYIYRSVTEEADQSAEEGFVKKGELYTKIFSQADGSFSISLPVGISYYVEAIVKENVSMKKIVTEVREEKATAIELEIALE